MAIFTTTDYVFFFNDEEEEDDYNIQEGDEEKLTVAVEESNQLLEEKKAGVPKQAEDSVGTPPISTHMQMVSKEIASAHRSESIEPKSKQYTETQLQEDGGQEFSTTGDAGPTKGSCCHNNLRSIKLKDLLLRPIADRKGDHCTMKTQYVLLLCSFKEQLQYHVHVHVMEAVRACFDLQHSLLTLTGVSPGEGTGATMSDDEDDHADSDTDLYDGGLDGGQDTVGLGPLIPTESERSLMERVRQELKVDLKQGYRAKIADVREEILRKRRAGKLPGDTTSRLKAWWQSHSKWPYPTEDEKARLVQETGLQLKQINNWFINQRKRNWQSNSSSSTTLKSKRKR